jgi:predicted metal-dependent phosphotriesterase family hydrolase
MPRRFPWLPQDAGHMTVLGPREPGEMGVTLPHEHVLVDFIGAAGVSHDRYNADEVFETALPHLQRVRQLGCRTVVECTPAYIGRDPLLLKRLATASGLNILSNTGYYGAGNNKFLPEHALRETPDQLAERWIREAKDGIEESGVRPGFIKIGVDSGTLSALHTKLVRAAAKTHLRTGLTIAAHTGDGSAALDELRVLEDEGLKADSFIWVHAQNETSADLHAYAAERGAWVEFDGISPTSIEQHVRLVKQMKQRGFLRKTLISHDAGWYHVGESRGGNFRAFDTMFTTFLPALRGAGFDDGDIHTLMVENPRDAFTIRVRASE